MRTWNDYKAHVKSVDAQARGDMEQIEEIAEIVGAMVEQRNAMGISRSDPVQAESEGHHRRCKRPQCD